MRGARLLIAAVAAALGAGCGASPRSQETARDGPAAAPGYVGSARCAACHVEETRRWAETAHGKHGTFAIAPPAGATLAVGSRWMQAYMEPSDSGLHRIHARCFELVEQRWRDVPEVLFEISGAARDDLERAGASPRRMPLEGRTFETDCSGCHASQAALDLEAPLGRLRSTMLEPSIGCEACHGPGEAHAKAWSRADASAPLARLERLAPRAQMALCARCHGGPPTVGDFGPQDAPDYVAVLHEAGGQFPDGRAAGQVYQVSSFVRSGCHLEGGLTCADCHDPHGPGRHGGSAGDVGCVRCHDGYARREHTHHAPDGAGARCVECHMPRLLSGLLAHQRDHRIGVPLPADRSSPDACTACHADRDKNWADRAWRAWWGEPPAATLDAVAAVAGLRRGKRDPAALERALTHPDPYYRAVAAKALGRSLAVVDDPLPEVRLAAALGAQRGLDGETALERLVRDDSLRVRAAAWRRRAELGMSVPVDARADLARGARHMRFDAPSRLLLAQLCGRAGLRAESVAWAEQAFLAHPMSVQIATQAASAWIEAGDHRRAAQILAAAKSAQPEAPGREHLGLLLERCLQSVPPQGRRP